MLDPTCFGYEIMDFLLAGDDVTQPTGDIRMVKSICYILAWLIAAQLYVDLFFNCICRYYVDISNKKWLQWFCESTVRLL